MVLYALFLPCFDNNIWAFNCITPITLIFLPILLFIIFSVLVLVHCLVHYILIITLVLIVLFSQIIPCRARRDFLDHIHVPIGNHRSFMVSMTQMTVSNQSFRVLCTNEAGRTYISGVRWAQLVARYEMQPGEKCTFYLDHNLDEIYFLYRPLMTLEMTSSLLWSCASYMCYVIIRIGGFE